jgi:excisionase family DNA binding protein
MNEFSQNESPDLRLLLGQSIGGPPYLNLREAARATTLDVRALRTAIHRGQLPAARPITGRRYIVSQADLMAWVASLQVRVVQSSQETDLQPLLKVAKGNSSAVIEPSKHLNLESFTGNTTEKEAN